MPSVDSTSRSIPTRPWQWTLRGSALVLALLATWKWTADGQAPTNRPASASTVDAAKSSRPVEIVERLFSELGIADVSASAEGNAAFEDVTESMGLAFAHDNDAHGRFYLPEAIGPGAALIDYDGDSDYDIFIAGGGSITGDGTLQFSVLYRNDGERFTDVTTQAMAAVRGHAFGVAVADIDADGDADIFISRLGGNALLRNMGDGRFEEVAMAAGVKSEGFATGATFFDYDKDGDLDLYVCRYVNWRPEVDQPCFNASGLRDYCSPASYNAPSTDRLFRNRGDGTFEDVSAAAGIETARGNGLGVVANDFDGDGWHDLYVANDASPAFMWRNKGDGTFENVAELRGCAFDGQGIAIAGMGVACEDFDGDADFDILVTNIRNQSHLLLENFAGHFADSSAAFGVPLWSMPKTGFGVACFDQDNDGRLDMFIANGAVNLTSATANLEQPFAEPQDFLRLNDGRFQNHSVGSGANATIVGRAVAMSDFDNDGDVDLLVTVNGGKARLFRNTAERTAAENAWLTLDIRDASGQSPAIGARVEMVVSGSKIVREVRAQSSYLASHDARVHIGLGTARTVDRIVITWPDGMMRAIESVQANRTVIVTPSAELPASKEGE